MTVSYNAPSGKRKSAVLTTFHLQRVCERGLGERLMQEHLLVMLLMQHMQQQHQRIQRLGRQH